LLCWMHWLLLINRKKTKLNNWKKKPKTLNPKSREIASFTSSVVYGE
jgi:hypothetical protein